MMKIKDINTALEIFKDSSTMQAEATEQGDYKTGNKNYDKIIWAVTFLKKENAIHHLESFLSNPSVGVRLWAACYLLNTNKKEAINVLEAIIKQKSIHSLTAETTLSEWRKGSLIL